MNIDGEHDHDLCAKCLEHECCATGEKKARVSNYSLWLRKHPDWREDQLAGKTATVTVKLDGNQMREIKDCVRDGVKRAQRERNLTLSLTAIAREVWRAHKLHGAKSMLEETSDDRRVRILIEEALEVVRAVNDEESAERVREELVQLAAMATTWLMAIDE